jgi:urease accessory protein
VKHATIASEQCQLDLSFVVRNGQTLLDRRLFSYPYVLMRTFGGGRTSWSTDVHSLQLVVQNSSGPVHDHDNLATSLVLDAATNVRIGYQGATAVHRARSGNESRERLSITLGEGAHLSYLPEARIYFPEARHRQVTDIALSAGSTIIFVDSFTTHDPEGQARPLSELDNTVTIRRDDETLFLDRQHLETPSFPAGFRAFGNLLLLGLDEPETPEIPGLYAARSRLPNNLGWSIRLAAPDLRLIRQLTAHLATSSPRPLWERVAAPGGLAALAELG